MNRRIFKYVLPFWSDGHVDRRGAESYVLREVGVDIPRDFKILTANLQRKPGGGDNYVVWADIDVDSEPQMVRFALVGTGWDSPPEEYKYINTVFEGSFVWHIYYKEPNVTN